MINSLLKFIHIYFGEATQVYSLSLYPLFGLEKSQIKPLEPETRAFFSQGLVVCNVMSLFEIVALLKYEYSPL